MLKESLEIEGITLTAVVMEDCTEELYYQLGFDVWRLFLNIKILNMLLKLSLKK